MTLATADQCSKATARALTDQLRTSLSLSWELLVEAYQRRAWAALGYASWDAYTDAELGETRLRLPREQRREVVASMTESGMSTRAIGSALGVNEATVSRDRARVADATPDEPIDAEIVHDEPYTLGERVARDLAASDRDYADALSEGDAAAIERELIAERDARSVLGTDGKTYPASPKPATPRRKPLPDAFWQAAWDLGKQVEKVVRLSEDDRFPRNAEEVAASHRNDLIRAIDALQGVVNRLPSA